MKSERGWIPLREAARACSVDGRTLARWAKAARGAFQRRGGELLISKSGLRRLLRGRGLPIPRGIRGNPVILVVDDEPDMRRIAALTLGRLWPQAEIASAGDGWEAAGKLKDLRPDLLVTDLRMPGLDGLMLCETARREPGLAGTKVLALTAFDDAETRVEIFERGADEYLRKPFDPEDLRAAALRLLGPNLA